MVVVPVDHGTMLGRVEGLEDPIAAVERFLKLSCDGFLMSPGVVARTAGLFAHRGAPARLLTLNSYWRAGDIGTSVPIGDVHAAAALGVDAVKVILPWSVPAPERATLVEMVTSVVEAAEPYGLPVLVEPVALDMERGPEASAIEADGCRVAVELGADILKVAYPGNPTAMATLCAELRVPLVLLGGPNSGTADELLGMVTDAIAAGASGTVIGRRIWQRSPQEAASLLEKLYAVVHSS
jgi:class I fructose-bisphosphate aldolase